MPAATPTPISAAERQRLYRARCKAHRFMAPVELGENHLDMLVAAGWLDEKDAHDRRACAVAIGRILDGLSKKPLRVTSTPKEPW